MNPIIKEADPEFERLLAEEAEIEEYEAEECPTCHESVDSCMCCGGCGYYNTCSACGGCFECGNCSCCEDCSNTRSECSCQSRVAPWINRGFNLERVAEAARQYRNMGWKEVWPEINWKLDPVQAAADFYLLEAMASASVFPRLKHAKILLPTKEQDNEFFKLMGITKGKVAIRKERDDARQERILNDPLYGMAVVSAAAEVMLGKLIEELDKTFVGYSHMAIAGEARHHNAFKYASPRMLDPNNRDVAWVEWRGIWETIGVEAIKDLAFLFREFDCGSYGGEPWAQPCEILYSRLQGELGPNDLINKKLFIDRVFTLQHNGGSFLDKIEWPPKNSLNWGVSSMHRILDAHATDNFRKLHQLATPAVAALYTEYYAKGAAIIEARGLRTPELTIPITTSPMFICNSCGSNPKVGHLNVCGLAAQWWGLEKNGMSKIAYNGCRDKYCRTFYEDELAEIQSEHYYWVPDGSPRPESYLFGADGMMYADEHKLFEIIYDSHIYPKTDSYHNGHYVGHSMNLPFKSVATGEFDKVVDEFFDGLKKYNGGPYGVPDDLFLNPWGISTTGFAKISYRPSDYASFWLNKGFEIHVGNLSDMKAQLKLELTKVHTNPNIAVVSTKVG